jgi:molybdate transport system regulatory protein
MAPWSHRVIDRRISLTLHLANGVGLSEEDVTLVETIGRCRSILGASRLIGVSYRKAWLMVDALNRCFETPVVATHPGRRGAGAEPTAFGLRVVALYRSAERQARRAAAAALTELDSGLATRDMASDATPETTVHR